MILVTTIYHYNNYQAECAFSTLSVVSLTNLLFIAICNVILHLYIIILGE